MHIHVSLKLKLCTLLQQKTILPKLDRIFATHRIPSVLKSDNGPPFFGEDFKAYMKENGIEHQRITPLWPQANSEAENFMKPLTKAVQAAHSEGRDWKKDLYRFLLNYQATPHSTTGIAPSQLLFGCTIKTKLPQLESEKHTEFDQEHRRRKGGGSRGWSPPPPPPPP